jgi:hypothetical protein
MYAFLSPEWVDAVRDIRDEYAPVVEAQHTGDDVAVNLLVTEVPHGDDVRAHAALRASGAALDLGHVDDAKVLVTVDYATARAAVVDQDVKAMIKGFLLGKIAIRGDLAGLIGTNGSSDPAQLLAAFDLSGVTTVGELDPTAAEISARVRAITR